MNSTDFHSDGFRLFDQTWKSLRRNLHSSACRTAHSSTNKCEAEFKQRKTWLRPKTIAGTLRLPDLIMNKLHKNAIYFSIESYKFCGNGSPATARCGMNAEYRRLYDLALCKQLKRKCILNARAFLNKSSSLLLRRRGKNYQICEGKIFPMRVVCEPRQVHRPPSWVRKSIARSEPTHGCNYALCLSQSAYQRQRPGRGATWGRTDAGRICPLSTQG
jgi:hypothetical protein